MYSAILREKTLLLHKAKQIHNHMCFQSYVFLSQDTPTRQIDRVQRRISEPYEHHCLKDNIGKKKTFERTLVFIVFVVAVVFFPMHLGGIYR